MLDNCKFKNVNEVISLNWDIDGGDAIAFELIKDDGETLYLHLFNYHNGYYSHSVKYGTKDNTIETSL